MKLAKLSLAAIVAAGAMTTFASAAPLEEAIKGVDLKGIVRYRVDINDNGTSNNTAAENHRFSGAFTFTVPVADNLKSVLTLRYDKADNAKAAEAAPDNTFGVGHAYFSYSTKDIVLNVGKQALDTPWTYNNPFDGNIANGALALYKGVEGWTFAGAAFVNVGNESSNTPGNLWSLATIEKITGLTGAAREPVSTYVQSQNLYAVAAIGSMGPVNAQFWVAKMTHVFDYSAFAELSTKYEGFSLKAQVNQLKLADEFEGFMNDDKGTFWAVEGGFAYEGASIKAGYLRNDKDQGIYTIANDNKMIREGKQIYGEFANLADAKTYFVSGGYKFDKYSVGAGYVKTKEGSVKFANEWFVEAGYAYSKNFSLYTYYSDLDREKAKTENKRLRMEAVYRF